MTLSRRIKKLRLTSALLISLIGNVFLTSCDFGQDSVSADRISIRYAVSPFQDTLLPVVAEELGWYEELGLDVEIVILGWTEVQTALASGSVDIGINNMSAVVATNHRAANLVYAYGLNTFDNGFALITRPNDGLRTLESFLEESGDRDEAIRRTAEQLRGRSVITTSNTDMEQGVAAAAQKGGVPFDEIEIINLPPGEGLAAFLTGTGDAYIGGIPQRTRAQQEGMLEMLSGVDLGPPPINGLVTSAEFMDRHPEVLAKLVNVWFRTVQYIEGREGPPGLTGAEIVVERLNETSGANFTLEDFWRFWNKLEHYPENLPAIEEQILNPSGPNYWRARWDDCNRYFYDIVQRIPEPVSPSNVFRMQELHELLKASEDQP